MNSITQEFRVSAQTPAAQKWPQQPSGPNVLTYQCERVAPANIAGSNAHFTFNTSQLMLWHADVLIGAIPKYENCSPWTRGRIEFVSQALRERVIWEWCAFMLKQVPSSRPVLQKRHSLCDGAPPPGANPNIDAYYRDWHIVLPTGRKMPIATPIFGADQLIEWMW